MIVHLPITGIVSGGAGGGALVQDTFTDTDGTLITAHTPDIDTVGGGWGGDANIDIKNNKAGSVSATNLVATIDSGVADVTVVTTWTVIKSGHGPAANMSNVLNFWMGIYESGVLAIYEVSSGTYIRRARGTVAVIGLAEITLTAAGDSITVDADTASAPVTYTVTNRPLKTATGIGWRMWQDSGYYGLTEITVT